MGTDSWTTSALYNHSVKLEPTIQVLDLLDSFANAMSERDIDATVACFSPGPSCVFIGSGLDERRVGEEEIRAHFSRDFVQSEWLTMRWVRRGVVPLGDAYTAWGVGEIEAGIGRERLETQFRFTAGVDDIDGEWRFVQAHLSFPAPGQRAGESWPASIERVVQELAAERMDELAQESPDGTVTLLFTDIENSSQALEARGDAAWLNVVRKHHEMVEEHAAAHQGHVVKSLGDGFMIAFRSAIKGIDCALDLQQRISSIDERRELRVRMGLHTGEVLREGADFFGKHVTLAARIAGHANGGQILVSELLRDLVEPGGNYSFEGGREVALKGLSGQHRIYEVTRRE